MRFKGTTNETCIYRGDWKAEDFLVCRKIDDFSMVSKRRQVLKDLIYEVRNKEKYLQKMGSYRGLKV